MDDYTKIDWSNPLSKHPLNDGLVGWWLVTPHNRGSFTWYDLSGNNYHGALTNMAQDDWVGKVNRHKGWGALDFDGTNDFVDAGNIPELEFIPRVTFSAWMKRNASGDYVSFGTYDPANADMLFLTQDADGNVYFWIGDGSFNAGYFTLNNTVWQHIIFTFDGDESVAADRVKGYINGVETTITNFGTLPTLTPVIADNFLIGKENTPNFTKGFIDDVRVYKRLLSPVESQDLYFRSLVHQKGLLLYRPNRKLFVPVGAVTVTPATLTLVSALLAPTIVADQNPTITPATLALTSTLQSPSFSTNDSYSPATLALALTLQAPTISIDDSYSPATLPLALTLQSPSFSTDDSYSPAALALALTLQAPTIDTSGNVTVTPSTLALTASLLAPVPDVTILPATQALTSALLAPSFSTNDSYSPATLALTLSLLAPTIVADQNPTVTPSTLALTSALLAPTVSISTGRTYITYDGTTMNIFVGGIEVARFKSNGDIDVNGNVNQNAF